jgi:hypothetical protein
LKPSAHTPTMPASYFDQLSPGVQEAIERMSLATTTPRALPASTAMTMP